MSALPNPIDNPAGIDELFQWQRAWSCEGQRIVEARSFNCEDPRHVYVVPCVWFSGNHVLVSESAGMPWDEYAGGFNRQGGTASEKQVDRALLLENAHLPSWVHDFLENPDISHVETNVHHEQSSSATAAETTDAMDDTDLLEDALDKAFRAIQVEVAKDKQPARKVAFHFKVQVEKRAAGTINHDTEFVAYQGLARTSDAKAFCVAVGLRRTCQFDTKTFGSRNAYVCAHEWADVMDYISTTIGCLRASHCKAMNSCPTLNHSWCRLK
eukprot:6430220-Amphidinium_carterae.2